MSGKKKKDKNRQDGAVLAMMAQVARNARTALSRQLLDLGLYAGQDALMLALDKDDGQTPGAIATKLGVKAPTITKTITRLSAQGFVRREEAPHDGRMSLVYLTEAGREKIKAVAKAQRQTEKKALGSLKGKDVRHLMELLEEVDANLARLMEKSELIDIEDDDADAADLAAAEHGVANGAGVDAGAEEPSRATE